jgi:transposase
LGNGFSGWQFYTCQKRGLKVGLTKVGKGTKISLATDKAGIPLAGLIESAQVSEYKLALPTIDLIEVPRRPRHPKRRPNKLCADRGYDAKWLRDEIRKRNIQPRIPKRRKPGQIEPRKMSNQLKEDYKLRWIVERTFSWLGNFRRTLIRWEKYDHIYEAFLKLAIIMFCLSRVLK